MRISLAHALALAVLMPGPSGAQDLALGESTFLGACAGCHGEDADGNGPMTEILTVPVPDLTRLAAENGGAFPWLRTVHMIDGTTGLRAHGGPMPIFGLVFDDDRVAADAPDGTPVIVSARVLAVVDYLQSLQKDPE